MRRYHAVGAAAAAAVAITGCGGTAAVSPAPAARDPLTRACVAAAGDAPWHGLARVRDGRVTLDAHDDYFAPSCLVVPAGQPVTLVVTNRGHLPHTLTAPGLHVAASLDAGQTAFVTLPALTHPARLVCGFHREEHMVLAVVPAVDISSSDD